MKLMGERASGRLGIARATAAAETYLYMAIDQLPD
jgi:hypothetical protein